MSRARLCICSKVATVVENRAGCLDKHVTLEDGDFFFYIPKNELISAIVSFGEIFNNVGLSGLD